MHDIGQSKPWSNLVVGSLLIPFKEPKLPNGELAEPSLAQCSLISIRDKLTIGYLVVSSDCILLPNKHEHVLVLLP